MSDTDNPQGEDWTCPTCGEDVVDMIGMVDHVDDSLNCPEKGETRD